MNKAVYELSRELRLHYEEAENYKALWARANDELEVAKAKCNQLELVLAGKAIVNTFVQPQLAPVPHAPGYGQGAIVNGVQMYSREALIDYAKTNVKVQNYAFDLHLKALALSNAESILPPQLPPQLPPPASTVGGVAYYTLDQITQHGLDMATLRSTPSLADFVNAPLPTLPSVLDHYDRISYTQQQLTGYGQICMRDQLAAIKRHLEESK